MSTCTGLFNIRVVLTSLPRKRFRRRSRIAALDVEAEVVGEVAEILSPAAQGQEKDKDQGAEKSMFTKIQAITSDF